jgi:hypothetical protein
MFNDVLVFHLLMFYKAFHQVHMHDNSSLTSDVTAMRVATERRKFECEADP